MVWEIECEVPVVWNIETDGEGPGGVGHWTPMSSNAIAAGCSQTECR